MTHHGVAGRGIDELDRGFCRLLPAVGPSGVLLRLEVRERRLHHRLNALARHVRREPAPHLQPVPVRVGERLALEHPVGQPDVGQDPGLGASEAGLRDADDLVRLAFEPDRLAERGRIAGESARPERMADHRHRMRARRHIVGRRENTAERRVNAERREGISRHELRLQLLLDVRGVGQPGLPERLLAQAEDVHVRRQRLTGALEERIAGECRETRVDRRAGPGQIGEAVRIADRQLAQDEGIDEREGGRARADGETERHHRGRGHDRVLAQQTQPEPDVTCQGLGAARELDVAAGFAQLQPMTELPRRLRQRLPPRESLRFEIAGAGFDVEALLLIQVFVEVRGSQRIASAVTTRTWLSPFAVQISSSSCPTASVTARQRCSSRSSCCRPASVTS